MPKEHSFLFGRVLLEPAVPDHIGDWKTFIQDPEVMRFIKGGWTPPDDELAMFLTENCRIWGRHRMGWWTATDKESNESVGACVLNVCASDASEIGYIVRRQFWRRGFGTELVRALCEYSFTVAALPEIKAYINVANTGSIRIVEGLHFRRVSEAVFSGRRCHRYDIRASELAELK